LALLSAAEFPLLQVVVVMAVPAAVAAGSGETLDCLLDVFASLKSSRDPRGTIYPLASTLALTLIALLWGCKNPSQIYAFARARPALLERLGFRPRKRPRKPENKGKISAPNEDTTTAILASVDQRSLNEKFALFLSRMVGRGARAAIDGKALRGSQDHVLSVFVNDLCQVVWQEECRNREHELRALERALPPLLERYPGLKLFTGDAAFCHKRVARQLVKARRDYFLQLKGPHTTDVGLARHSFEQITSGSPPLAASGEKRGARRGRSG
jgi:hypothetical protein